MLKAWAHSMTSLRTGENTRISSTTISLRLSSNRIIYGTVELEMSRLCIIESYVGGLTELNEALGINLTAGKLVVTICVHELAYMLFSSLGAPILRT